MALTVHKPGQGYWTRLLSGIGAMVLVVAGAHWAWTKIAGAQWSVDNVQKVVAVAPANAGGDVLNGFGFMDVKPGPAASGGVQIGRVIPGTAANTAGIVSDDVVTEINAKPVTKPEEVTIALTQVAAGKNIEIVVHRHRPIGIFIQIPVAIVMVLGFGALVGNLVAVRPSTSDFLIATEGEMRKVNWPVRREVIGSTWVVICCVILLSFLLWASDIAFSTFFKAIGIIQGG